jgi:Tfp pilus assembly protein PilF
MPDILNPTPQILHAAVLQVWATLEAQRAALGGGADAAKAARDLFRRSVEADPDHAAAWHAWAVYERSKVRGAGDWET